ncbi:transcriptional regulator, TetR family [Pseudonocardia thermophila]|uniref:Transcriptional regulator, TetR family n=1 Tax=Pseudonocardia thermophila TaxID=1848 RepID=A0A1M6UJW1_PSETH|nr:TetR/AcrR family transcriptional regulator [Pseudonocardia thermophila]SHK69467.1 transcriptional regulator, TetR family [Pseudonocardia thermophila]
MNVPRDRRTSRWDAHRRTRRAQLVDAAIQAIREQGAGVGMDEVAARARTSKTVVYRHFADRAALYVAVCRRVAQVLAERIRTVMQGDGDPRTRTTAAIEAYLEMVEHDRELYRFVVHRPLVDSTPGDPLADLVSMLGDQAAEVIAEELARAGLDPAPAPTWGHALVGLVRGAADHWLAAPAGVTRTELAARITEFAWHGLAGVTEGAR